MDLSSRYLGLNLRTPLVAAAGPLTESVDNIKRLEDAGIAAVVLPSLFEEQLVLETHEIHHHLTHNTESYAEALTYFPEPDEVFLGPEEHLARIAGAKEAVNVPVIASLNGSSLGGWPAYAKNMQEAGADAVELNLYDIPTDPNETAAAVELRYLEVVEEVKASVTVPVAVKLSPFFTNLANVAKRMDDAGADGFVLFNRFYQPDIDLENLEVVSNVILSTPQALRLPMRWIAILHGRVRADLAATSGIHSAEDVLKMVMAGAGATQVLSVLLKNGIDHVAAIEAGVRDWMAEREYESIEQMRGSMSQEHCEDPSAFERAQYMRTLKSYRPDGRT